MVKLEEAQSHLWQDEYTKMVFPRATIIRYLLYTLQIIPPLNY